MGYYTVYNQDKKNILGKYCNYIYVLQEFGCLGLLEANFRYGT